MAFKNVTFMGTPYGWVASHISGFGDDTLPHTTSGAVDAPGNSVAHTSTWITSAVSARSRLRRARGSTLSYHFRNIVHLGLEHSTYTGIPAACNTLDSRATCNTLESRAACSTLESQQHAIPLNPRQHAIPLAPRQHAIPSAPGQRALLVQHSWEINLTCYH